MGTGIGGSVTTIAVDASANILVGGTFSSYDGSGCSGIIKLNLDGTINQTFYENMGTGMGLNYPNQVNSITVDAYANILVGGTFNLYDGSGCSNIIKLNPDGTINQTFYENMGTGIDGDAYATVINTIAVDAFENILVGGSFNSYDGSGCSGIIKLTSDGTIDLIFYENMGTGIGGSVNTIAVDAFENILVGGNFSSYDGSGCSNIIKLNPDGTINQTFYENMGTGISGDGYSTVKSIAVDASVNIIIGGNFTSYDGSGCSGIIKLLKNDEPSIYYNQLNNAIAIGYQAGYYTQGSNTIAIGTNSGNYLQHTHAIALGKNAGYFNQGAYSVAIGTYAGNSSQADNSIILNATGAAVNQTIPNTFTVKPIRSNAEPDATLNALIYTASSGEITYGNKTFVIDHPQDQAKYLVHACLEGPEAGVYYRGTATIPAGANFTEITLPHYVAALATEFTVHATPVMLAEQAGFKSLAVSRVHEGKFKVYQKKTNNFWFMRKKTPQHFDYVVFGKRAAINVEPVKTDVEVKGQGPYTWL
jgi:hypothetical protein